MKTLLKTAKEKFRNVVELTMEMDKVIMDLPVRPENAKKVINALNENNIQTIMLTVDAVKNSGAENRPEVISAIYARIPILAAHYLREGGVEVSRQALKLYKSKVQLSIVQRVVVKLLYLYTAIGGRGAGRVLNKLKIELNETDEK